MLARRAPAPALGVAWDELPAVANLLPLLTLHVEHARDAREVADEVTPVHPELVLALLQRLELAVVAPRVLRMGVGE